MSIHWPLQTPVNCWVIHFVDKYNQMLYSSSFGQHGMLSCLASFLKACFKLSFPCRDYLQRKKITIKSGIEVNGKTNRQPFSEWQSNPFSLTSVFKQRPLLYHNHIALLMAQGFPWISWISGSTSWNFSGQSFSAYSTLWLTSTAKSACEAPPIMLGTKLLWPGASRMVKCFFSVSKYARPTSTVFPLSLSSWFVSRAQERYLRKTFTMKNNNNNNRSTFRHKRQVLQVSAMFGGNLFDYPPDDLVN